VDAVVLMASTCVLGPHRYSHVVCPDWTHEVVLYRDAGGLACLAAGEMEIDGARHEGRARLTHQSRVVSHAGCFSLEPA
jgi:hypothetical protein